MKKKIILLFVIIMFVFSGCENDKNNLSPQTEQNNSEFSQISQYTIQTETIMETITLDNKEDNTENKINTIYTISYTYPVITSQKKENITKVLNESFRNEAREFIKNLKESNKIESANNNAKMAKTEKKEFYPHSSTVNYILQYNKNNIVSFLKAQEDYTGGINHIYHSNGITYNLETGKKMELSDVFEATDLGLIKILSNGFKNEAVKNKEIFKNKTDFTEEELINNMKNLNWYLSEEGIVFFFNPNTIIKETNEILQFTYAYSGNKTMFKEPINK